MHRLTLIILFVLSMCTGCASITTGQNQSVSIDTPNCPAATCRLSNSDGTYFVSNTPETVVVNRACGKLTIQCSKEGKQDYDMSVSSSIKAVAWGNILFGGLIGAGVDAATGAACEYPQFIPVPMNCEAGDPEKAGAEIKIPSLVMDTAKDLECDAPVFLARSPDGEDVYSANCQEKNILLNCDSKECSISEYKIEGGT